jgi:SAM-dependent methyltransferase
MKSPLSPLSSINKLWNHLSIWGKLLIGIVLVMSIYYMLPSKWQQGSKGKESFVNRKGKFHLKEGDEVYDGFYSQIYDYLVYSDVLDDYEIGAIIQKTEPDSHSIILDIGSGTGHTTSKLASNHQFKVKGLDKSESMVRQAQAAYPDVDFIHGDAMRGSTFGAGSFTHILCTYFTIYYFQDKARFFENCYKWLKPGGFLVVHVVDRDMFDPIIPPANPLSMLTPQRYAKERITTSKVTFDTFKYHSNFVLDPSSDEAQFIEKFHFNDGRVRKNVHKMYMPTEDAIVRMGQDAGFVVHGDIDLIHAGYEYNHLVLFYKPE